jgi:hypothetical protein
MTADPQKVGCIKNMSICALLSSYSSAQLSNYSVWVAVVAAAVWFVAALVRLPVPPTKQYMGVSNIPLLVKRLRIQAWLNAIAAALTAVAVGLQAAAKHC